MEMKKTCYFFIKGYGTTAQLGIRLFKNSAATSALGRPTSLGLQKKKKLIRNSDQSLAQNTKTVHITNSFATTTGSNVNNCSDGNQCFQYRWLPAFKSNFRYKH